MTQVDLREMRTSLKQIRDDGTSALYENRGGAACPVCGEEFDEVLATSERTRSIRPSSPLGFCLVNQGDEIFVFTHA